MSVKEWKVWVGEGVHPPETQPPASAPLLFSLSRTSDQRAGNMWGNVTQGNGRLLDRSGPDLALDRPRVGR